MTAMELLLLINNDQRILFYDPIDLCFTNRSLNQKETDRVLALMDKDGFLPSGTDIVENIMLPSFHAINHEQIMRFFVRECVEDKEIRKTLFYILRRDDYVDPFIDKLKELGLYDDFDDCCGSIYYQILEEWAEKRGIDLTSKD